MDTDRSIGPHTNLPATGVAQTPGQPRVNYLLYAVGDVGNCIYGLVPSILLMFYMTSTLGIPVGLATMAVTLPRFIDLILTSVIAGLSDRTRTRIGRRRPYMLAGAVLAIPAFAALWLAPFSDPVLSAYFVLGATVLGGIAIPCFTVGFYALNAELPRDYHDRTRLNTFRTAYTYIGALLAGSGAPLLVTLAGGGRVGYRYMGLVLGAVIAITTLTSFFAAREPEVSRSERKPTIKETIRTISANRPYHVLTATYFVYIVSVIGLFSTMLPYFVTYLLGRGTSFLSMIFLVKYVSAILSTPFWNWAAVRIGKLRSLQLCFAFILLSSVAYFAIDRATPPTLIMATVVLYGVAGAGIQVQIWSMLADCIHHGEAQANSRMSGGMYTGLFLSAEKLAGTAGALLCGLVLWATGYVEGESTVQPEAALTGIRLSLSAFQLLLIGTAFAVIWRYQPFERLMLYRVSSRQDESRAPM